MSCPPFVTAKSFCSVIKFFVEIFRDRTFCVQKLRLNRFSLSYALDFKIPCGGTLRRHSRQRVPRQEGGEVRYGSVQNRWAA